MCLLPTSFLLNIQSRGQTGSGHAADSKLQYTVQFSILMLCAKYQASVVPEKNVTEIFWDADTDNARRRLVYTYELVMRAIASLWFPRDVNYDPTQSGGS